MKKKIAIIHYSYPPVIGGVEFIIYGHASVMAQHGHRVRIITGSGESGDKNIELRHIEGISATDAETKIVQEELSRGVISERFEKLKRRLTKEIQRELRGIQVCFIHNILTMHFNLALNAALMEIINRTSTKTRYYAWCHDATPFNPDYSLFCPRRYPWNLVSKMAPGALYVAISKMRQRQLGRLFKTSLRSIRVVPDGIDIKSFLGISDSIWRLALDFKLFDQNLVLFYPSRILGRKNYELAIRTVKAITKWEKKVKLLLTGAPDPHNPATALYWCELSKLIKKLRLRSSVVLIHDLKRRYGEDFRIGYLELKNLYDLSDMLFITSRQEGFGIPLLEAASKKLPIACSEIPPFREIASNQALFFGLDERPEAIARRIKQFMKENPSHNMFRKVLREYSWEAIYENHLKKLIR